MQERTGKSLKWTASSLPALARGLARPLRSWRKGSDNISAVYRKPGWLIRGLSLLLLAVLVLSACTGAMAISFYDLLPILSTEHGPVAPPASLEKGPGLLVFRFPPTVI